MNNNFCTLSTASFWKRTCFHSSCVLWSRNVEVMYVFNYFRHSISYLKIYAMKHLYVSHILCKLFFLINYFIFIICHIWKIFVDYLLSNNHVNSIIVHKFDFSDEEVMAYYISFLKTLSLKLNTHTIHFFYNEVNEVHVISLYVSYLISHLISYMPNFFIIILRNVF